MELRDAEPINGTDNIELAKKCLALIRDISDRGVCSQNPDDIGYALEELFQVLFERTGRDDRFFEPISADQVRSLPWLHEELAFVDSCSASMAASAATSASGDKG